MASNLVPTRITNKNGVSTTVYKAVDKSGTKSSGPKLPPPAVAAELQRVPPTGDKRVDDMNEYIHLRVQHISASRRVQDRMMNTLNPETTRIIAHTIGLDNAPVIGPAVDWCLQARSFNLLNNLAVITVPEDATRLAGQVHLRSVHGLSRDEKNPVNLSSLDETEVDKYRAVVLAADKVHGSEVENVSGGPTIGRKLWLRDPEMVQLIMDNHERVEEIIAMVNERTRPFDRELFQSLLDNPAPAIREGEL